MLAGSVAVLARSEATKQSIEVKQQCRSNGGEPPLPLRERVGVRGHGPSIDLNPSPGSLRDPTSPARGEVTHLRARRINFQTALFADTPPHSRGAISPGLCKILRPKGVGNAGRTMHPQPGGQKRVGGHTSSSHHRSTGITRHSRTRMVLTVSFVLSPVTGLSCHRRRRSCLHRLDTSVGVSGPHDFAVRLSAVRLWRSGVHRIPLQRP
jgi:hypothetical protein